MHSMRTGRGALIFVYLTIVLDSLGIGLLVPIMPRLIETLSGEGLRQAAVYAGWLTAVFATMQFLAAPVLGALSDQFGRRSVLLVSLAAFGANYLLMAFAPSLAWIFLAQGLAGVFGATRSTAGAYVADVSQPEDRPRLFGLLGASFGIGFMIGPVIGGVLVGYGLRVPFFVAAALALLNVIYGLLVLPESLPRAGRRPFTIRRANLFGATRQLKRNAVAGSLLTALALLQIANQTLPATWPYFAMHAFGWSAAQVGYSLGLFGICGIVIQGTVVARLVAGLGGVGTAVLGLCAMIVGYCGFATAAQGWMLIALIPAAAMGFATASVINGLLSAQAPANLQGALQGVVASLGSLAAIVTPLLMPRIFRYFSSPQSIPQLPGAPYLVAAALAAASIWLIRRGARGEPAPT